MESLTSQEGSLPAAPLSGLSEVELRVLSYSSAMGKEFDFDVLQYVSEMEEERLAEILEGLVHRGVLGEMKGGDMYEFVREDMQGQLYRAISSSRVRLIHKKIAEAYERVFSGDPPQEAIAEMGRHYHLGRVAEKSVMYNRYAATLARGSFSPETAVRYLERVLEDLKDPRDSRTPEEAEALREIGDLQMEMGEASVADEYFARSLQKAPERDLTLRALLLLSRGDAARETYRLDTARGYANEAILLLHRIGNKGGMAKAHRLLSRISLMEDKPDLAMEETEKVLSLLDPVQDAREVARCYIEMANASSSTSTPEGQEMTLEYLRKAIVELEPLEDFHELFRAHNNLAVALGPDNPKEALAQLTAAKACAEKVKDRRSVGWALFNSVEFLLTLDREAEASNANEQAYRIISKLDDPLGMQQIVLNRGILAQKRKAYPAAEVSFRDGLKRGVELGRPGIVIEMHLRLAALYAEWGKVPEGRTEIARMEVIGLDKLSLQLKYMYDDTKRKLGARA